MTLADVARRAGLSKSAASMILNGRPDTRLSKDAHDRVHQAATELGYRPNALARGLWTGKTQSIAFISDHVATARFAGGLIKGALEAAETLGHVVFVLETGGDPKREASALAAVLDRQVDGVILASLRSRELVAPGVPAGTAVVMLNATSESYSTSVLPDEFSGGGSAVQLLVDNGHREGIALIGQSEKAEKDLFRSNAINQRVAGIRSTMAANGIDFVAEESVWVWEPEQGYAAASRVLKRHPEARAFVCMNDRLAFGAYQAIAESGRSVPHDVSIVSFDNDEIASYLRPGLTTVALPHEAMGAAAVRLLLSKDGAGQTLVPMPLIERESVARVSPSAPRP